MNCLLILLTLSFLVGCSSSWIPENEAFLPTSIATSNSLNIKFLGVSNIYLNDGKTSLLVDGFFSRLGASAIIHGLKTDTKAVDAVLQKAEITSLNALLVAHTHFDHILDTEYVAKKMSTGQDVPTKIFGTELGRDIIIDHEYCAVIDGKTIKVGEFKVTFIETPHVRKTKRVETFEKIHLWATRGQKYEEVGENFSFYIEHRFGNVLIVPSASYFPNKFEGLKADIIFLGTGLVGNIGIDYVYKYWDETVGLSGAKLVVPIHWDNFFKPLSEKLIPASDLVDDLRLTMSAFHEKAKATPDVEIYLMHPFKNVNLQEALDCSASSKGSIETHEKRSNLEC
jgi:L-ascorbate metabolism protein UlaG (beta-lactamase superfamily)